MAVPDETLRELRRARENLQSAVDLFSNGSDAAVDLIAGCVRTMCNWSTAPKSGYESLLKQANLVTQIRFPSKPRRFGCEVMGLHFPLFDGLDLCYKGGKLFGQLGSFSINSNDAGILVESPNHISLIGMDMKDNIPGTGWNIDFFEVNESDCLALANYSKVIGIWRSIDISTKLNQSFSDWWTGTKALGHQKRAYTRQELIDYVANKSGGSHVSPKLSSENLYRLENDKFEQLKNIHIGQSGLHKTVHIIGIELLAALDKYCE